ncbi:MAG: hypothetical protein GXY74_15205 [Phycisphaerae bacterium]|nr:hypothetical protein [Phycisphaerae bacterium]
MLVERSTLHQSAVGSLFSLLNKSDSADAPSFQQHFTESVGALSRRDQTPQQRSQESLDQDVTASRPRTEPRRKDDPAARQDAPATTASAPPAAPVEEPQATEPAAPADTADREVVARESAPAERATAARDSAAAPVSDESSQPAEAVATPSRTRIKVAMLRALAAGGRGLPGPLTAVDAIAPDEAGQVDQPSQGKALAAVRPVSASADSLPTDAGAAADQAQLQSAASGAAATQTDDRRPVRRAAASSFKQAASQAASSSSAAAGVRSTASEQQTGDAAATSPKTSQAASGASQPRLPVVPQAHVVNADVVSLQVVSQPAVESVATGGSAASETPAVGKVAADASPMRSAGVKPAADASRATASDAEEQVERIVHVMRASISRGGSRVNMRLDPPELGQLRIQMQIRNGEMTARFETQTETARNWVYSQLGSLRESLAGQNIRLVQASVESRHDGNEAAGGQSGGAGSFTGGHETGGQTQQHNQTQHQDAAPESEVLRWTAPVAEDNEVNVVV